MYSFSELFEWTVPVNTVNTTWFKPHLQGSLITSAVSLLSCPNLSHHYLQSIHQNKTWNLRTITCWSWCSYYRLLWNWTPSASRGNSIVLMSALWSERPPGPLPSQILITEAHCGTHRGRDMPEHVEAITLGAPWHTHMYIHTPGSGPQTLYFNYFVRKVNLSQSMRVWKCFHSYQGVVHHTTIKYNAKWNVQSQENIGSVRLVYLPVTDNSP